MIVSADRAVARMDIATVATATFVAATVLTTVRIMALTIRGRTAITIPTGTIPYWFWDSDSSDSSGSDNGYDQDVAAAAGRTGRILLNKPKKQEMMRQEQADGDQDLYARAVALRPVQHEAAGAPILPIRCWSFAINTSWRSATTPLSARRCGASVGSVPKKIPLSDLDLPATQKANESVA